MRTLRILLSLAITALFSTAAMAATVTIHNAGADVNATLSGAGVSVDTSGNVVLTVSESLSLSSGGGGGTSDTTAPGVPSGLTATAASSSQINLSWSASTDNVGVAGYKIYRAGTQIATTGSTSYSNTGLQASTNYCYTVAAYDSAGNTSSQSSQSCANTQAASTGTSSCIDLGPQYPKVYGCTSTTTSSCSAQIIPAGGAVNYCFTIDIATAASILVTMSSLDWITSSHEFLSNISNPTSSETRTILASGSVANSTGNPPWYSIGSGSNERIVVRGQSAKKGDKYYVTVYNPGTTSSKIILYWNAYSY